MIAVSETTESLLPINLKNFTRAELREYFADSWTLNDTLFRSLRKEQAFYLNPDPLRNPLIFYLGHTAAFYMNKLCAARVLNKGVASSFKRLFAAGVDPETPAELVESLRGIAWPKPCEVWDYRVKCFDAVMGIIERVDIELPIGSESPLWALLMGIEHDRIHFETSSVLFRQLPADLLRRPDEWRYAPTFGDPPQNEMIYIPGGAAHLGKPRDFPTYGWDNEYGHLNVKLEPFYASKYLVSNLDFLAFVEDGGYLERAYWDGESWAWRSAYQVTKPKFWVKAKEGYRYRALFEDVAMPWDWPVEVNHHEASAYCRWKGDGTRLLTEAEWNVLAGARTSLDGAEYGDDPAYTGRYNLNLKFGSPCPVNMLKEAVSPFGCYDALGNVWVWLSDRFKPLPGFKPHRLYDDFSVPFFDEKHSMMLGGSWATTGTGASRFYRLWFRRHFYQHAGFRVAS
jgi:5-histidylcysteine sulfoxide synthase